MLNSTYNSSLETCKISSKRESSCLFPWQHAVDSAILFRFRQASSCQAEKEKSGKSLRR